MNEKFISQRRESIILERMTIYRRAVFYSKYISERVGDRGIVNSFVWITDEGIYIGFFQDQLLSNEEYSSNERIALKFRNQRAG